MSDFQLVYPMFALVLLTGTVFTLISRAGWC
jgi:hypothetical protein